MEGRPELGLIAEEIEFHRVSPFVGCDIRVHPVGVPAEAVQRFGRHVFNDPGGTPPDPYDAEHPVERERRLTEELGEPPFPGSARKVHLPQTVLRVHVPCRDHQVVFVRGLNLRDTVCVTQDVYFGGQSVDTQCPRRDRKGLADLVKEK